MSRPAAAHDEMRRSRKNASVRSRAFSGRMTFLVNEVNREHRVCVLGNPERVPLRRVDLNASNAAPSSAAGDQIARPGQAGSAGETKAEDGHVASLGKQGLRLKDADRLAGSSRTEREATVD